MDNIELMNKEFKNFINRLEKSKDSFRATATEKRHHVGFRTARENLEDLADPDSFFGIW